MIHCLATSVIGSAHVETGMPCQDAWLFQSDNDAMIGVVCDGLGSKKSSHLGSTTACTAALEAWKVWKSSGVGTPEDFIRLLEVTWRLMLRDTPPGDSATTCIVFIQDHHQRCFVAQLGDGMFIKRRADNIYLHPYQQHDFGFTKGLGITHTLNDWTIHQLPFLKEGESILMLSDGLSEDIEMDSISPLIQYLVDEVAQDPSPEHRLTTELTDWDSHDDKTLLLIWREG